MRVAVVSKVHVTRSHSVAAQGGIAASLGNEEEDHWEWHMYDTVKGSDYLADQDAVEDFSQRSPKRHLHLEHMGVPFSRNTQGKIEQRRFGGHTKNFGEAPIKRACYASDRTGQSNHGYPLRPMPPKRRNMSQRSLHINTCFSAQQLLWSSRIRRRKRHTTRFPCQSSRSCDRGSGKIYKTTSNGFASTGDGFALALDAMLPLEDMEFVQFHPTGIYGLGILISEAARAEGGVLRNGLGERFMERYAPTLKDLAPRDIISRAILKEISEGRGVDGKDYVYFDLREIGKERLNQKLPEIILIH